MEEFEFSVDVQQRIRDRDGMGHVNNAVYLTYLELAREEYVEAVTGDSLLELGAALANLEIEFLAPIEGGQDVDVAVGVDELGTSSAVFAYEIRADGKPAARAETTLVAFDREAGESKPLPEYWRQSITDFEEL